jgi:hypothetical protein
MDLTRLSAVERDGHWTVQITWSNGIKRYFGEFSSERDAGQWIKQNKWLTAERIDEKDIVLHGSRST